MNDYDSCGKVVEMRGVLDCLHDKEDEVCKRAIQELQWDKKKWKLKGSERISSNIVGLLENIDGYEGSTSIDEEEEDDM